MLRGSACGRWLVMVGKWLVLVLMVVALRHFDTVTILVDRWGYASRCFSIKACLHDAMPSQDKLGR
jgi:hypothetical protein